MKTIFHSGDLGDIIYAMPVFREIGMVRILLGTRWWNKEFTEGRFNAIADLLRAQLYVESVEFSDPAVTGGVVDFDFSKYREIGYQRMRNIVDTQAEWALGRHLKYEPWIEATPDPRTAGRVVVHRTPRWRGQYFPWEGVAGYFGDRLLSVCDDVEHADLEETCGRKIERSRPADLLELAGMIGGSDAFLGNQSSPMAVAIGIGHPVIQETSLRVPDCVFPGADIKYGTWRVSLGEEDFLGRISIGDRRQPPGKWQMVRDGVVVVGGSISEMTKKGFDVVDVLRENTLRVGELYPSFLKLGGFNPFETAEEIKRKK